MANAYSGSTYTREEAIARSLNDLDPNQAEGLDVMNAAEGEKISPQVLEPAAPKKEKIETPEKKAKVRQFKYTEPELFSMLEQADAAQDTLAASAIADEIRALRTAGVNSQEGGFAVSTDIISQDVRTQGNNNVRAALATGINQAFAGAMGTNVEIMLSSSYTGRLFGTNPKTGETELFQSTPSWLGITDQEWDDMSQDDRRKQINTRTTQTINEQFHPDRSSVAFNLAKFAGMLADPTTAIPFGGSWGMMLAKGGAIGGTDMAAWSYAQKGEVTPTDLAIGVGAGMIPGGAKAGYTGYKAASKSVSRLLTPKTRREAADKLLAFEKAFQRNRKVFDNHTAAYLETINKAGMTDDTLNLWIKQSQTGKSFQKTRDGANYLFEPVSDRFRKMAPSLHKSLIDMERKILDTSHKIMTASDSYLNALTKLEKKLPLEFHSLKKAMLNSDGVAINKLIKETLPKSTKDYETYRLAMKEMWKLSSSSREGLIGKEVEHYTHRAVKDYRAIRNWLLAKGGKTDVEHIDKLIKKEFDGRTPTEEELNGFYSRYLSGIYDPRKVKHTPGATKGRKLKVIPDELVPAFHNPDVATHSYVRSMTEDAYKKAIFGKEIVKKHGDNLTDSVAAFLQKERAAGRISPDDIDELKTLLNLRFVDGIKKPIEFIQKFKDLSYAMLLGNPISAITQLGDVFLATWKVGFRNSMQGLGKSITGKGLSPREFGLMDSMLEEMVSTGTTKRWLRRALKYSGFRAVDRIGKATLMNGSLLRYQKLSSTPKGIEKIRKQWGEAFGNDFDRLIKEIETSKKGDLSGDVKTLVFADLADVQPVTLLEMPAGYLANPNGRVVYMLRTFQLKYMNLLRKTTVEGFEKGNRTKAIMSGTALMAMFTAGGVTSDLLKHAVLSRDPNLDEIITDNIIANTGIFGSRYDAGKIIGRKPLSDIAGQFIPPVGVFDPFAYAFLQAASGNGVTREDAASMMTKLPPYGRLIENYLLGGKEKFADKQFKKSIKVEVDLDEFKL